MGYSLEGTIEGVAKGDFGYVVVLTNGEKVVIGGPTLLNAVWKITGAKKKGNNESIFNTELKGKKLVLAIQ